MKRSWIKSSAIKTAGYDPGTETLELRYHSGRIYRYYNVPAYHYEGLRLAKSAGRYVNTHVKNYPVEEISSEDS